MATRSNIAYQSRPDGRIISIYCHWDGYVANNGKILAEHYTNSAKIAQLVALGSISRLGAEIGEQQNFDDRSTQKDTWTLAYHRDRSELLTVSVHNDIPEWIDCMEEYAYLWTGTEWLVNTHARKDAHGWPVFERVEDLLLRAAATAE